MLGIDIIVKFSITCEHSV